MTVYSQYNQDLTEFEILNLDETAGTVKGKLSLSRDELTELYEQIKLYYEPVTLGSRN